MKTIKISEAQDQVLDWLVALAQGAQQIKAPENQRWMLHWPSPIFGDQPKWSMRAPHYSTDWAQGGPIIEREGINVEYDGDWVYDPANQAPDDEPDNGDRWLAAPWNNGTLGQYGPTPLVAAMRCYVASKLGETVEVPEELL